MVAGRARKQLIRKIASEEGVNYMKAHNLFVERENARKKSVPKVSVIYGLTGVGKSSFLDSLFSNSEERKALLTLPEHLSSHSDTVRESRHVFVDEGALRGEPLQLLSGKHYWIVVHSTSTGMLNSVGEKLAGEYEIVESVEVVRDADGFHHRTHDLTGIGKVPAQGKTVVVSSARGGTGKTTAAVQISNALAERGKKVALLDADFADGASVMLSKISIAHEYGSRFQRNLANGQYKFDLVSYRESPSMNRPDWKTVERLIAMMKEEYDYVVVDVFGAHTATVNQMLIASADLLITVGVHQPSSAYSNEWVRLVESQKNILSLLYAEPEVELSEEFRTVIASHLRKEFYADAGWVLKNEHLTPYRKLAELVLSR